MDSNKVIVSKNVRFYENIFPFVNIYDMSRDSVISKDNVEKDDLESNSSSGDIRDRP